jgi:Holliday junction resolvase RusA-like endonuclease
MIMHIQDAKSPKQAWDTLVKNLIDALASIGAHVDDEDLVTVTLNGLGKNYSQFRTSIAV